MNETIHPVLLNVTTEGYGLRGLSFYLVGRPNFFDGDAEPQESIARVTWEPIPPNFIVEPSFRLKATAAQRLMDELWLAGVRPSDSRHTSEVLAVQGKHLEDMRELAMGALRKAGAL